MTTHENTLVTYIETPRRPASVVKLDTVLEARMRDFIRARRVRRFTFFK